MLARQHEAEWVAIKAAYMNWGEEAAQHVQITAGEVVRFCADPAEIQAALELLLKCSAPDVPSRKHLTIEANDYEVCFTVSDSLWPITDERAETKRTLDASIGDLEHRWCAIRYADITVRRVGGYITLKESNGHLAVSMHLARSLNRLERQLYA